MAWRDGPDWYESTTANEYGLSLFFYTSHRQQRPSTLAIATPGLDCLLINATSRSSEEGQWKRTNFWNTNHDYDEVFKVTAQPTASMPTDLCPYCIYLRSPGGEVTTITCECDQEKAVYTVA